VALAVCLTPMPESGEGNRMSDQRKHAHREPASSRSNQVLHGPAGQLVLDGRPVDLPTDQAAATRADPEGQPASARSRLKRAVRAVLPREVADGLGVTLVRAQIKSGSLVSDPMQFRRRAYQRECPICGFSGRFWSHGTPPRGEAMCPRCLSLERHRLLHLLIDRHGAELLAGRKVLHFAPETCVRDRLGRMSDYVTADISGRGVDYGCPMEQIPFPDASIDAVIANHVLEHVDDDIVAMREVHRVLRPGGVAILSVPLIAGWEQTYEDPGIVAPELRRTHFGQEDHKRLYGADFSGRLQRAGFAVEVFRADPESEVRYGLRRGDRFFLARPVAAQVAEAAD